MPTYSFQMSARVAGSSVSVTAVGSSTVVASGTLDTNSLFTASLPVGDYVATAAGGHYSYKSAGTVAQSDPDQLADLNSTFARKGSASIDLNAGPYNATVGTDITSKLQDALNWIAANCAHGGEVYFSEPGQYLVNGAPQTGTAQGYTYNGQILIPAVGLAQSMPIRIRGAIPSSGGGQSTGAPNGVILKSNATSGYVFDIVPGFTEFGCPWTGVMPIFENLVIRTSDNPTVGGINLYCTQRMSLNRVQIDTPTSWVAPLAGTLPALVMPMVYNNGDCTVRDTTIRGYPVGIQLGEHGVFDNVDIAYCMTAFVGGGASHPNWFGYVDVEECPTMFKGGNAPTFGSPLPVAGSIIYGAVDFENGKRSPDPLAPAAFVDDTSTNRIIGKLDVGGTVSGTHPVKGGTRLDLVPVTTTSAMGPRQSGLGWQEAHPFDNFKREGDISGAGAPGQCAPTLHPWRVELGGFTVTSAGLKGTTGDDRCFVPVNRAGNYSQIAGSAPSRTVTVKFTLGATSPHLRVYAHSPWTGSGAASGGTTGIELNIVGGSSITLRENNSNLIGAGPTLANGTSHTVQLAVYCNAVGYPSSVKVYLDGALIITSPITTQLGGQNPSLWPFYEDGIRLQDTTTAVTLFAVQDITVDPAFIKSGTAALVAGAATVADSKITATSRVRVFNQAAGGTVGALSVALNAGVGFTINSTSGTDTSSVYYEIVNY